VLIKIVIAFLLIVGAALGGEMALTSAVVDQLKRSDNAPAEPAAAVKPFHADGIRCFAGRANSSRRKVCIA